MLETGLGRLRGLPLLAPLRRAPAWLAPFTLTAVGCTAFEAGSDVRVANSDGQLAGAQGTERTVVQSEQPQGGSSSSDWSCLRPADELGALVTNPEAPRLIQSLQVVSLTTGAVLPGISVRACAQRDVDCVEPITPTMIPDADGWVDVPLYEGFDGYLEISGDVIVPTTLFYSNPLGMETRSDETPLGLVEKSVLPSLSAATGTAQDENLGLVYLRAFDCGGVEAPGIVFSIDRPGVGWYFIDGLPTVSAEETAASGLGGFMNVPPGVAVVNAAIGASGTAIAPPKSVVVRRGWMAGLRWVPKVSP